MFTNAFQVLNFTRCNKKRKGKKNPPQKGGGGISVVLQFLFKELIPFPNCSASLTFEKINKNINS